MFLAEMATVISFHDVMNELAMTQCTHRSLEFHGLGRRKLTARFDAPAIMTDPGGLLLREMDAKPDTLTVVVLPGTRPSVNG